MDGTVFFYFGGALVLAALVLSYFGIRGKESFPPSSATLTGLTVVFGVIVIGTAAYAVANAREEQEHRDEELAEEEEQAAAEEPPPPPPGGAPPPGGPPPSDGPGPAETLDVTSPADGGLTFDPDGLEAQAGTITLAYDNPSPVPHSIAIEIEDGAEESQEVTMGAVEVTAELPPGEYVFYCAVPGHRESGMEGTLTVE